jgi:hypothetical protein
MTADGSANYVFAKAGVVGLTKRTAREAGPYAINVNCAAPGLIVTPLTFERRGKEVGDRLIEERKNVAVLGRVGRPEDVANLVLFLVSEDSRFMSGQIIPGLYGLDRSDVLSKGRQAQRGEARSLFCCVCVRQLKTPVVDLARLLGMAPSTVSYAVTRGKRIAEEKGFRIGKELSNN